MTIEQQIDARVEARMQEALPEIIEKVKEALQVQQVNQQLFNQKEMAARRHVSVTTFKKMRKMGLPSASSPTGKLLFDARVVDQWCETHDLRKVK